MSTVRKDPAYFMYFPGNYRWSAAFINMMGTAIYGGADIGELDKAGRLLIKGRKKEMIVTAQGLNVFPEDVERALAAQPGVREAGVIGKRVSGEERVHAVLVLDDVGEGADLDTIVRGANATLEDHQRVWSTSIWPDRALPRTEGTQKLKRRELQKWVAGETTTSPTSTGSSVEAVVGRFASGRALKPETTLDELGLSSLDRVELTMALEEAFHTTIEESDLANAKTIEDLRRLVENTDMPVAGTAVEHQSPDPLVFPRWNRWPISWLLRRISLPTWILPLGRPFLDLRVDGLEHLKDLRGPVIFASNHQSHFDGPTLLIALPPRWRYWVAPAMSREFFYAHFNRRAVPFKSWLTNSLNYFGASMFFNAFPLAQSGAGTRQTLRYVGEVTGSGYSILIFPEGVRHEEGEMAPFRPGVGMIASRLDIPVVPVRLEGVDKILQRNWRWPRRGPARVAFGAPLRLAGEDYPALARQVEQAVRALGSVGPQT